MERNEISAQEIGVYLALVKASRQWLTNREIAQAMEPAGNERTVRLHTRRFVQMGLLDVAEVFPAHRFQWAEKAGKRNQSYLLRLKQAAQVFTVEEIK